MKKVLITGGADGIGLAIAKIFNKNGYKTYTIDLKQAKEKIATKHYIADINDEEQIKTIIKDINDIDIIINNAAIQTISLFNETSIEDLKKVINTNLLSTIIFTKQALDILNDNGQIINIGSVHSSKPRKNKLSYDVSKAGLKMFTQTLALELAPNYRVNQVDFGAVKTPMNEIFETDEKAYLASKERVPLNYIFNSEDVAKVVYNITQEDFKYMTGTVLIYDGGRSLI